VPVKLSTSEKSLALHGTTHGTPTTCYSHCSIETKYTSPNISTTYTDFWFLKKKLRPGEGSVLQVTSPLILDIRLKYPQSRSHQPFTNIIPPATLSSDLSPWPSNLTQSVSSGISILGQRSCSVIVNTHTHTHTEWTALPGPLQWLVRMNLSGGMPRITSHHIWLRLSHGPAVRRQVLQLPRLGRSEKQPDKSNNEADQRLGVVAILDRTCFWRGNTALQMHVQITNNDDETAPSKPRFTFVACLVLKCFPYSCLHPTPHSLICVFLLAVCNNFSFLTRFVGYQIWQVTCKNAVASKVFHTDLCGLSYLVANSCIRKSNRKTCMLMLFAANKLNGLRYPSVDVDVFATSTACCDLWPPESNLVIIMGYWIFPISFVEIAQTVHEISGNKIWPYERTDQQTNEHGGQTAWKHNVFADTDGWQMHINSKIKGDPMSSSNLSVLLQYWLTASQQCTNNCQQSMSANLSWWCAFSITAGASLPCQTVNQPQGHGIGPDTTWNKVTAAYACVSTNTINWHTAHTSNLYTGWAKKPDQFWMLITFNTDDIP